MCRYDSGGGGRVLRTCLEPRTSWPKLYKLKCNLIFHISNRLSDILDPLLPEIKRPSEVQPLLK